MALSPDMIEEEINQAQKCKLTWELVKIVPDKKSNDICTTDLNYIVKSNWIHYKFNTSFLSWECSIDTAYHMHEDEKIWDTLYILANKIWYWIFDTRKKVYDKYSEVPFCKENKVEYSADNTIFTTTWFITLLLILVFILRKHFYNKNLKNKKNR